MTDSLRSGRVPERTNGTVSKTVVGLGPPGVQIPLLPPIRVVTSLLIFHKTWMLQQPQLQCLTGDANEAE